MSDLKKQDKTELKKVAKAIEYGVDLKKLEREIATLESKKISAINQLDEMKTSVNKEILEDRKLIAKERQDFDSEIAEKKRQLITLEEEIKDRDKQVSKKQKEFLNLQNEIEQHNSAVLIFSKEKENVEKVRVASLEKEHLANLTIEQYEKKIKELNKKIESLNK